MQTVIRDDECILIVRLNFGPLQPVLPSTYVQISKPRLGSPKSPSLSVPHAGKRYESKPHHVHAPAVTYTFHH
jgi:hypothetical protein